MRISILWTLPVLALVGTAPAVSAAPAARAPLHVTVTCSGTVCEAAASGGSGTYMGFEWNPTASNVLWETENISQVDVSPVCGPGDMVPVNAFVRDSNGVGAMGGTWAFCPLTPL